MNLRVEIDERVEELREAGERVEKLRERVENLLPRAQQKHQALLAMGEQLEAAVKESVSDAQQAITGLHGEIVGLGGARSEAARQIAAAAALLETAHEQAQTSLERLDATVDAAVPRVRKLAERSREWFEALATDAQSEAKEPLQTVEQTWTQELEKLEESTRASFEDHRNQLGTLLEAFKATGTRVENVLQTDADALRAQVSTSFQDLSAGVESNVRNLSNRLGGVFERVRDDADQLNQQITSIRSELANLTGTVSETAQTATAAMESTNVGLNTAMELFDNLRATLEDIEELWQS